MGKLLNLLKKYLILVAALTIFYSEISYAAEQGSLDSNESQGNIYLDLRIADIVLISNLEDFDFSNWNLTAQDVIEQSDDVCVYSNKLMNRKYAITASGTGTGSAFTVTNEAGEEIPYQVYWNDSAGIDNGRSELISNKILNNQKDASIDSLDCGGDDNARISIAFSRDNIEAAIIGGTYNGTLYIAISPE